MTSGIRVGKWLAANGGGLEILTIGKDGQLIGRYQTKVGKPNPATRFDAYGATHGILIGFSVAWRNDTEDHSSLTSWTGRYLAPNEEDGLGDRSKERLELQWHLARLRSDDVPPRGYAMWEMFLSNYSVLYFT